MSFSRCLSSALLTAVVALDAAFAANLPPPTGDEILGMVRMSQALQDLKHLKGKLRNDDTGQEFPLDLTMSGNVIRFVFPNPPKEIINLDLNNNGTNLTRISSGGKVEMPTSLYGESVRGTAINFEDLSMRFLYWPNSKVIDEDSISFQKCWVVRVKNPDGRGPYQYVDLWIHKDSGAMMQMRAYDARGKLRKEFKVRKAQKYNKAYILKQMRVESYNPDSGKVNGRTYLEIDDPD